MVLRCFTISEIEYAVAPTFPVNVLSAWTVFDGPLAVKPVAFVPVEDCCATGVALKNPIFWSVAVPILVPVVVSVTRLRVDAVRSPFSVKPAHSNGANAESLARRTCNVVEERLRAGKLLVVPANCISPDELILKNNESEALPDVAGARKISKASALEP